MSELSDSQKIWKVFFNIPNTICHVRIILSLIAYWLFFNQPLIALICYFLSANLDNLDGPCARYFHQQSKFGAVYDMVIDRMTTIILMMHMSLLMPHLTHWLAVLSVLDFSSHWCQMYAAEMSKCQSHKALTHKSYVLSIYYGSPLIKFLFSLGFETFLGGLYISRFGPQGHAFIFSQKILNINRFVLYHISLPLFLGRQVIITFYYLIQFVNLVQLITACQVIVQIDDQRIKEKFEEQNRLKIK